MEHHNHAENRLGRDAFITFAVVMLAVAAIDDITTDSALSFPLERTALVGCAAWFLVVARRLWRQGHRVFGVMSFGIVTIAALAQPTLGPSTLPMPLRYVGYGATVGAVAWFLLLAGILAGFAWRARRSLPASPLAGAGRA